MFVQMTRDMPRVPDWTFYDIRRGRRRVWGSLLRCIAKAIEHGAPRDVMLMIPQIIESFIDECYQDRTVSHRRSA